MLSIGQDLLKEAGGLQEELFNVVVHVFDNIMYGSKKAHQSLD